MKKFKFLSKMEDYADMFRGRPNPTPADKLVILLNSLREQINTLDEDRSTKIDFLEKTLESFYSHASGMVSKNRELVQENTALKNEIEGYKKKLGEHGSN